MTEALESIDISHVPELLRIAEEVRNSRTPRVLRRDGEDVAVLMPVAPHAGRRRKRAKTEADDEAFLASAGAWKGHVHRHLRSRSSSALADSRIIGVVSQGTIEGNGKALMTTKESLHRLIDELPDEELVAAERLLAGLRNHAHDPVLYALLTAPLDDEPTTPEEDAGAAEARQEYRRGEVLSPEAAKRLLLS